MHSEQLLPPNSPQFYSEATIFMSTVNISVSKQYIAKTVNNGYGQFRVAERIALSNIVREMLTWIENFVHGVSAAQNPNNALL